MLRGIGEEQIVVGAYVHRDGICPMLAAHRRGDQASTIAFAHAWDHFAAGGAPAIRPRPATARELLVLRTHLEASLLEDDTPEPDLAAAIAEHRKLVNRRRREESAAARRPGHGERR